MTMYFIYQLLAPLEVGRKVDTVAKAHSFVNLSQMNLAEKALLCEVGEDQVD